MMAWRAYNALMGDSRLLVLDTRSARAYADRHIRGSVCVELSSNGRTLERIAGPGPPTWSKNCWWDRNILIVSPNYSRRREEKTRKGDNEETGERDRKRRRKNDAKADDDDADPITDFLLKEGLVKSVKILEVGSDESKDAFSLFARAYPFLVTKSTKAATIPSYPAEIVPGLLYLGDLEHAKAVSRLEDLQITHILTIHTDPLTMKAKFKQLFLNLADESGANIAQHFEPSYQFVEEAESEGGKVLIHCGAGASRSATLCAAYLIYLKEQRKQVAPNDGFLAALNKYEEDLGLAPAKPHVRVSQFSAAVEAPSVPPQDTSRTPDLMTGISSPGRSAGKTGDAYLEIMKGGVVVGTVALTGKNGELVFGRASTCDVVLDHASISRQHARLSCEASRKVRIQDMGSAHGTFLNGKQLKSGERQRLSVGDTLRFGASTRSYVLQGKVH